MYNIVKDVRGVGEGDWEKLLSHLLREMWIEIRFTRKLCWLHVGVISCGRCGLKYLPAHYADRGYKSHLLREMWIEILYFKMVTSNHKSHLLREMWIEIPMQSKMDWELGSHLLREMWIEITVSLYHLALYSESSPAGDVD